LDYAAAGSFCSLAAEKFVPPILPVHTFGRRERDAFENVKEVGVFYAAMLTPILILGGWTLHVGKPSVEVRWIFEAVLYGIILIFAWAWRDTLKRSLVWPPRHTPLMALLVVLVPAMTLGAVCLESHRLFPLLHVQLQRYADDMRGAGHGWVAVFISVAVAPAICEEIGFRGLILRKLEFVMTAQQALIVSSLLFAIIHYDVLALVVFLVPLAYAAGWAVQKSGSLWPAILMHGLHNAGVLVLQRWFL
jgi:membrane protease YdiL (CAAX protease family)